MTDMQLVHDELDRYKRERDEGYQALKWRVKELMFVIEADSNAMHCDPESVRCYGAQFIVKTTQFEELKEMLS